MIQKNILKDITITIEIIIILISNIIRIIMKGIEMTSKQVNVYIMKAREQHLLKLREYYQKNKEQIDAYNVNYRKTHRERILECNRQRYWKLKAEKEQLKLV